MARNINNNIPREFKKIRYVGTRKSEKKVTRYKFIKKYNENNYLYQDLENGFMECFCASDLGLVASVDIGTTHGNLFKLPKI